MAERVVIPKSQIKWQPPAGHYLFRIRIKERTERDYIQVVASPSDVLSFENFIRLIARLFDLRGDTRIRRVRKDTNVRIRGDPDMRRLEYFECFEITLMELRDLDPWTPLPAAARFH